MACEKHPNLGDWCALCAGKVKPRIAPNEEAKRRKALEQIEKAKARPADPKKRYGRCALHGKRCNSLREQTMCNVALLEEADHNRVTILAWEAAMQMMLSDDQARRDAYASATGAFFGSAWKTQRNTVLHAEDPPLRMKPRSD